MTTPSDEPESEIVTTPRFSLSREPALRDSLAPLPAVCAALHAVALGLLLVAAPGTEAEPDPETRMRHVQEHLVVWRTVWVVWMASAVSLVTFYGWWSRRVGGGAASWVALGLGATGMLCDLTGELILGFGLVHSDTSISEATVDDFVITQRLATLFMAGLANALYTLGGVVLTLRSRGLPRIIVFSMWLTWAAGVLMTVSAFLQFANGIVASTAVLFPTFVLWVSWMALRWR